MLKRCDAFFSTCATDPLRFGLAMATLQRLKQDTSLDTYVLRTSDAWLEPKDMPSTTLFATPQEFQRERRITAADKAGTDIYLMADDDVLPLDGDFVEKGLELMESHPQFGVICLRAIGVQYLDFPGFKDDDVEEAAEAGGLYFIRKGLLKKWPKVQAYLRAGDSPAVLNNYDMLQSEWMREAGFKVGRFRNLTMNHTGLCYSMATYNTSGYVHA